MKRRLTKAYDRMTMPDRCSQKIEQRLQQEVEGRKTGSYTKAVFPDSRNRPWAATVAAVCLMIALFGGGTALLLRMSDTMMKTPEETAATTAPEQTQETFFPEETVLAETPEDHYAVATHFSVAQVEAFAVEVRQNLLEENWEAFSRQVRYPISIRVIGSNDTVELHHIDSDGGMLNLLLHNEVSEIFREELKKESCIAMFCNWQGICMGSGQIWINEVDGALRVTAVNGLFGETPADPTYAARNCFENVLKETASFYADDFGKTMTIGEYCEKMGEAQDTEVSVSHFTLADMDDDGVKELILRLLTEEKTDMGHLVLRYQEGDSVRGWQFGRGELYDLKKDGSFFWSGKGSGHGEARLVFRQEEVSKQLTEDISQTDKPSALWYVYPCERADFVLESYEFVSGTGQTLLPGTLYYTFDPLVHEIMGNDWAMIQQQLIGWGMICREEKDTVCVYDPDAPGTVLYGILTEEEGMRRFSQIGYYFCTEEGEYQAEIREMTSRFPQYWVDVHLAEQGAARQVYSQEEILSYLAIP